MRAMTPYFTKTFGNPSSLHSFGQDAIASLDRFRESLARLLSADFRNIIFTGSATEANNLALRGVIRRARELRPLPERISFVVSSIEHESVRETARTLAREYDADLREIPADRRGIIDLRAFEQALDPSVILVSIMYANNEVGAIQPVAEIGSVLDAFRKKQEGNGVVTRRKGMPGVQYPLFHCDAVQAFQFLSCIPDEFRADLMTLSAHKIYGPKGVGALYARDLTLLVPIITGGGQEFGLRSGTENTAAAAGFSCAAEIALPLRAREAKRLRALAVRFRRALMRAVPEAAVNGPGPDSADALPHILNIRFPGVPAEALLTALDRVGVAASSGSACASRAGTPSHVLRAMGYDETHARESVRFSFGRATNVRSVDRAAALAGKLVRSLMNR